MSANRLMNIILIGIKQLKDPYYQGFAATIAFYLLLSIVPILIILSQMLGLFSVSLDFLSEMIQIYVKGDAAMILQTVIKSTPSGITNIALILIAIWSASKAQFSMMRVTNYTMTGGKSTGNGYFKERFRAIKTVLFTVFTVTFSLVILVYGELILKMLAFMLMKSVDLDAYISQFWLIVRWPIAMLLYFIMVSYNYYILPSWRVKYLDIVPGSIFASAGMLMVTMIFNFYMNTNIDNYDIIYGSLGSFIALMVWFYLISWTVGLGVVFNKAWNDSKKIIQ